MTGRRSFLKALLATAVVDPERLLWVPGKKIISIPKILHPAESYNMFEYRMYRAKRAIELYGECPLPKQYILHPLQVEAYERLSNWNHIR